jgi:hypothetical protein
MWIMSKGPRLVPGHDMLESDFSVPAQEFHQLAEKSDTIHLLGRVKRIGGNESHEPLSPENWRRDSRLIRMN